MNILVTGSSRGIGKAIAKRFAAQGHFVVINGRDKMLLDGIINEFSNWSEQVLAVDADLSVYSEAKRLFKKSEIFLSKTLYTGFDVLINNAGTAHIGLFQDMTENEWQAVMNTNLNSMLNCSHLAIPYMVAHKHGVIINISSIWGNVGASCEAVYAMTKGGVNAFTKSLAKELGPSGIRVNAIACGVIDTKMNGFLSDEEIGLLIDEIPLLRFGTPEEVAYMAEFIASENAAYMNGQIITLDGGMT